MADEPPLADQSSIPQSGTHLCSLCLEIDIVALIDNLESYPARTIPHQPSYAELVRTGASCELCAIFQASLFKEENIGVDDNAPRPDFLRRVSTGLSNISMTGGVADVVAWHEDLDRNANPTPFYLEIKAESTMNADLATEYVIRYQRPAASAVVAETTKPRRLILSVDWDFGLRIKNRPVASFPSWRLYSEWLSECCRGTRHTKCNKPEPTSLPLRLIDVGEGSEACIPKLAITGGTQGKYLTLSYCWGRSQAFVTKTSNLDSHMSSIPFNDFPKMFQDAMIVTKILGYRYIWIDSLCIVQDDVADWENECSRMGDIYRNSVCTISAPTASDSTIGFLTHRTEKDIPSCRLTAHRDGRSLGFVSIGLPPPEKDPSILYTRAWVLQEQILSPRTLCFGQSGMYFQCNSHEYLEMYHHPLPAERNTSWRTSRASDLPKPLLGMACHDVFFWYSIARQYSFRVLTYGEDKLPALSGLANLISATHHDLGEYWAGLWSSDICRGLTWTSDTNWDPSNPLHDSDPHIPSWSWASQTTPVEWNLLRDFRSEFKCTSCKMELVTEHGFGRVRSGILTLNGATKSASLRRNPSGSNRTKVYLSGIADVREVAELSLDHSSSALLAMVWPARDISCSCRLLMLGKAESSRSGTRWYALVLLPMGEGKHRRLGLANSLGDGATHARSLGPRQSYEWFESAGQEDVVVI